ncbi:precorrin-3B synthase [Rhizobium sp. SGZ-381]|uniref:precorrin-3B synthase n=1 Tax=Rhizobium sp. SGZ-381 TaxID=3342800 RepID=UPI00366C3EB6
MTTVPATSLPLSSVVAPLSPLARGACPALSAPMPTGDGLLTRVALAAPIGPGDLSSLCDLSRRHGNGILDVTARGNLQIRGLDHQSAVDLERAVRDLPLPLREGLAVEWSPLAGEDGSEIADPRPLGEAIIARARLLSGQLAPKLSVVIEGGGAIRLDHLLADIRLTADRQHGTLFWGLTLGGTAGSGRRLGLVADDEAADLVEDLLQHLARLGPKTRGRDLDPAHLPQLDRLRPASETASAVPAPTAPFGLFALSEGLSALRIALPFGQVEAARLAALSEVAAKAGILWLKPAPDHALVFAGPQQACADVLAHAEKSGFISGGGDPLAEISACPGQPSCRSGRYATHETGRFAASNAAASLDGSIRLHLSGCAKGCAHPGVATLTFVGSDAGTHLVFEGKTSDTPLKTLVPHTETAALAMLDRLVRLKRQPTETSRDCLARLGPRAIAAALSEGR